MYNRILYIKSTQSIYTMKEILYKIRNFAKLGKPHALH